MRGFSDEEWATIRECIVETGRDLVRTLGPAKTTITDITDRIGIAKSTFYLFFNTKADLYYEMFFRDHDDFLSRATQELNGVTDAEAGLHQLLQIYISCIEHSPLLQKTVVEYDETFVRGIPEQSIRQQQQET